MNLTQQELADRVGVAQSVLSKYELGKTMPGADTYLNLSRVLDISPLRLFGYDEDLDENNELEDYEVEMLQMLRGMSPQNRLRLVEIAKVLEKNL